MKLILTSRFKQQLSLTFETGTFLLIQAWKWTQCIALSWLRTCSSLPASAFWILKWTRSSSHLLITGFIFLFFFLHRTALCLGLWTLTVASVLTVSSPGHWWGSLCAAVLSCSVPWTETDEHCTQPTVYTATYIGQHHFSFWCWPGSRNTR